MGGHAGAQHVLDAEALGQRPTGRPGGEQGAAERRSEHAGQHGVGAQRAVLLGAGVLGTQGAGEVGAFVEPRENVMKAGEVAALFAVPVSTVLHWGRTGVLRRIKLGRHVRFFRADIERLVREHDDDAIA